jgi:hypothetical protein
MYAYIPAGRPARLAEIRFFLNVFSGDIGPEQSELQKNFLDSPNSPSFFETLVANAPNVTSQFQHFCEGAGIVESWDSARLRKCNAPKSSYAVAMVSQFFLQLLMI